MRNQDLNVFDYVPDIYKKEKYVAYNSSVIYSDNGQSLWERTEYNDLQPPPIRKQPGRPKKKRNKEAHEPLKDDAQMRRDRWRMKYSRCKQSGNNKSTCKLPPPPIPSTTEGSSNPASSEGSSHQSAQVTFQPPPTAQGTQTTQVTGQGTQSAETAQRNGTKNQTTQRVSRTQPTSQGAKLSQRTTTTQRTQPTSQRNAAAYPNQGAATKGAHTSQRPATSQRNASTQRTQGAQTEGGQKRKRKEKQQVSATQPEGSKAKKKIYSARVKGSVST